MIEFTTEQQELIHRIVLWFRTDTKTKPWFAYSGAAGTGKTTVIHEVIRQLQLSQDDVATAAYVGKAVLVLLRHGLPASTIHSLIYKTSVVPVKESTERWDGEIDTVTRYKMVHTLRTELERETVRLLVIDEASMVDDDLRDKLLSFQIPIIFIGDNNQLPPIFGVSSVMLHPDFCLTQIMRQERGNAIIDLSQQVLRGELLQPGTYGSSRVIDYLPIDDRLVADYDIILCAKNAIRDQLNDVIRETILGYPRRQPILKDKIICRQNDWDMECNGMFLTNGTIGTIENMDHSSLGRGYLTIDFQPDYMEESFQNIRMDSKFIRLGYEDRKSFGISKNEKFEFGYVITTHLSQGSEYPRVLFLDDWFHNEDTTRRLEYTAITRASESITILRRVPKWNPHYRRQIGF